jgi:hypothetical protein
MALKGSNIENEYQKKSSARVRIVQPTNFQKAKISLAHLYVMIIVCYYTERHKSLHIHTQRYAF